MFFSVILNYFCKKSHLFFGCISSYIVPFVNNSDNNSKKFIRTRSIRRPTHIKKKISSILYG